MKASTAMTRSPLCPDDLLGLVAQQLPHRRPELFFEFLRRGYDMVRLSNAGQGHDETALVAKLALGCIITAIDDLADHPLHVDERALERTAALILAPEQLVSPQSDLESLLLMLRSELVSRVRELPGGEALLRLFSFDLAQIVHANNYHALLTAMPRLGNRSEMRMYGPYNMGMVAAHMIDLMTVENYRLECLGRDREVFLWGQRYSRISNMIFTFEREAHEGDVTSELLNQGGVLAALATRDELLAEQVELLRRIEATTGTSFDGMRYRDGMWKFRQLHEELADYL